MAYSINGIPAASWDDVLQNAATGDAVTVSNESISGHELVGQTPAEGIFWTIDSTTFSGNSNTGEGGALSIIDGSGNISNSVFENNSTDNSYGGALYVIAGEVTITGTLFSGNTVYTASNYHGGALYNSGITTITGSTFAGNAARTGGAIYNDGDLTLTDVLFTGNSAGYGGGALRNNGGSVSLSGVTFSGNFSSDYAVRNKGRMEILGMITVGAGETVFNEGTIVVDGSGFITGTAVDVVKVVEAENSSWYAQSNTASITATEGYGLLWDSEKIDLYVVNADTADSLVSTNASSLPVFDGLYSVTDAQTGASYISAAVTDKLENASGKVVIDGITYKGGLTLSGTNSYYGINGAGFDGGTRIELGSGTNTEFNGLTFRNYTAALNGSVIAANSSGSKKLAIRDCIFENNTTSYTYSGAVHVYKASAQISDSVFRNNSNTNSKGYGGVLQCAGAMTVSGTLFENNTSYTGGAVAVWSNSDVSISDTIFRKNFSNSSGGAVYVEGGKASFTDVWFDGNSSTYGGAIRNAGGNVTLNGVTFTDNKLLSGSDGPAILNDSKGTITITGEIILGDGQKIKNSGSISVDGAAFLADGRSIARVVDAGGAWLTGTDFTTAGGYTFVTISNDLYITDGGDYTEVDYLVSNDGRNTVAIDAVGTTYLARQATDTLSGTSGKIVLNDYIHSGEAQYAVSISGNTFIGGSNGAVFTGNNSGVFKIGKSSSVNTFSGLTFSDNSTTANGAALYNGYSGCTVNLNNSTFSGNDAVNGGAIGWGNNGNLNLSGSDFTGNNSTKSGAALYVDNTAANITVNDCIFSANNAGNYAGAAYLKGTAQISSSKFLSNSAKNGGAVYNSGTVTLNDTVFSGNSSVENGGAVYNSGTATVSSSTFLNNSAKNGGAIYSDSTLNFTGVVFRDNTATSNGGAVYVNSGSVSFTDVWFDGNSANIGGAFRAGSSAHVTLSGVTFTGNKASSSSNGVAFYNEGTVDITGRIVMGSDQSLYNKGVTTVKSASFLDDTPSVALVVDAGTGYQYWLKKNAFVTDSDSSKLFVISQDMYITNADAVYAANTQLGGDFVYDDLESALKAGNSTVLGESFNSENSITVSGAETIIGMNNAALNSEVSVTVDGALTLKSMIIGGEITNNGIVSLTGDNSIQANISGTGAINVADADITFANTGEISVAALNFAGENTFVLGEGSVTFAGFSFASGATLAFTGDTVDLSGVTISIATGDITTDVITVATGVSSVGSVTLTGDNADLFTYSVSNNNLYLVKKNEISGTKVVGENGALLVTGGGITGTAFSSAVYQEKVVSVVTGGTIGKNLLGGVWSNSGVAEKVESVSLDIAGGEVKGYVYSGGYLIGSGSDIPTEAQMNVGNVALTLTGGEINKDIYGGIHVRENGYGKADSVAITINGNGVYGNVFGGGWAERNAKSEVGAVTISVTGGEINRLFAGGGASLADTTNISSVGTSEVTISGGTVNYVYLSGLNQQTAITGSVQLTVDAENSFKLITGYDFNGADSTGVATGVAIKANVTCNTMSNIEKLTIGENCTLTLGNAADIDEIVFDADGEFDWTALSADNLETAFASTVFHIGDASYEGLGALIASDFADFGENNKSIILKKGTLA